jgi:sugar lactone lactonase YvrE
VGLLGAGTQFGAPSLEYIDGVTTEALTHPYALDFAHDGSLLVSSFALDHVVRISWTLGDQSRARYRVFARVDSPIGLAYDATGALTGAERTLLVGSFTADLIYAFDDEGNQLRTFGDEDELDCPEGMGWGPDGLLYVVSFLQQHVVRYDARTGRSLGRFTPVRVDKGHGPRPSSALVGPEDLAWALVAPANANAPAEWGLFVTSFYSDCVQQFNGSTGDWVRTLGRGIVSGPVGIEVSPFDPTQLYVSSHRHNRVHVFDAQTGAYTGVAVGASEPGEDRRWRKGGLLGPTALAFSPGDKTLFVASYVNSHILRFNYSSEAERYAVYSRLTQLPDRPRAAQRRAAPAGPA